MTKITNRNITDFGKAQIVNLLKSMAHKGGSNVKKNLLGKVFDILQFN